MLRFGKATKTDVRHSVAHVPHDRKRRLAAKEALKYPPVLFTDEQIECIARGFADAVAEGGYVLHACSILKDHVHVVPARHERTAERIMAHLKSKASMRLNAEGLHPLGAYCDESGRTPTPWAAGCWKVFIDTCDHIEAAIRYVERNPVREGKPVQRFPFVVPYR